MPELPEVEALCQDLTCRLKDRAVTGIEVLEISALKTFDPPLEALQGGFFEGVTRHGKYLDFRVSGLHLIVHLARAGWIRWREELTPGPVRRARRSPVALRVVLDDGTGFELTEAGTRKGLAVHVVRDPGEVPGIAGLGPDPLAEDFGKDQLAEILSEAGAAQIKGVLRSQSRIAGIGNAYSDEILHAARMSPFKAANSLNDEQLEALYSAIQEVLEDAISRSSGLAASELKGEKKSHLAVHGRAGEPCPVCGTTIAEVSFADSSLQYCPICQTRGRILADRRMSRLLK